MKQIHINLVFNISQSADELPAEVSSLVKKAISSAEDAYAPYSRFRVGAAVLLDDGTVHIGNNQENAAYPSGLCAERVAMFSASAHHPGKKVKAIAVFARGEDSSYTDPVTPCGSCRQALLEYENKQDSPIPVYMSGPNGKVIRAESIKALLPMAFGSFQLTGEQ